MNLGKDIVFDPETVVVLKSTLEDVWSSLPANARARTTKVLVASKMLSVAAKGERDPSVLRSRTLMSILSPSVAAL